MSMMSKTMFQLAAGLMALADGGGSGYGGVEVEEQAQEEEKPSNDYEEAMRQKKYTTAAALDPETYDRAQREAFNKRGPMGEEWIPERYLLEQCTENGGDPWEVRVGNEKARLSGCLPGNFSTFQGI